MDQQYTLRLEKIETVLNQWLPLIGGDRGSGIGDRGLDNKEQKQKDEWAREVFGNNINTFHGILTEPCRDLLSRGGKRWRPLLMALACEACGGGDAAIPLAPLVEFCHNASLIHDDIEDNSDERRGKPAVHLIYGIDTAINSGSFLYFLPLACIDSWAEKYKPSEKKIAEIYSLWGLHIRKLHLGQAMDIHWHRNFDAMPSVEEYLAMCGMKTGCLARFAAELGVAVAGKTTPLGVAAEKLGIGFQILDDVKNLTTGLPGKKRGDDIVEGKKSLPILLYLQRSPDKIEDVRRCFAAARSGGVNAPETGELLQSLLSSGAAADAETIGRNLIAEAREAFAQAGPLLGGLADLVG